ANSEDILHSSSVAAVRIDENNWELLSNADALQDCELEISSIASAIEKTFQTNLSELTIVFTSLQNGVAIVHVINSPRPVTIDDEMKYAEVMLTYANKML